MDEESIFAAALAEKALSQRNEFLDRAYAGDALLRSRVEALLGEGGFGIGFLAEQQKPIRRRVALKVIKPGMDTRQVIARFEAKRQALALMVHPNIAQVHDGGETASGWPYFVVELVKGTQMKVRDRPRGTSLERVGGCRRRLGTSWS